MMIIALLFFLAGLLMLWGVVLANGSRTAPGDRLQWKWMFVLPLTISFVLFVIGWLA